MKMFDVQYKVDNWSGTQKSVRVVARSITQAVAEVTKKKYIGSSGRVVSATEVHIDVVLAK